MAAKHAIYVHGEGQTIMATNESTHSTSKRILRIATHRVLPLVWALVLWWVVFTGHPPVGSHPWLYYTAKLATAIYGTMLAIDYWIRR